MKNNGNKHVVTMLALGLVAAFLICNGTAAFAGDTGSSERWVSLFNGKDLSGWEGLHGAWRVKDGAITGESSKEKPCEKTHYLYYTAAEPGDFILRCEIKLVGGNSGIQFRSQKRPGFDTDGYQADFDATNQWTGCLYQHRRGAVVLRGKKATVALDNARAARKRGDLTATRELVRGLLDAFQKLAEPIWWDLEYYFFNLGLEAWHAKDLETASTIWGKPTRPRYVGSAVR